MKLGSCGSLVNWSGVWGRFRAGLRQLGVRRDEYEKGARSVAKLGLILEQRLL